jgi:hypothetical protein
MYSTALKSISRTGVFSLTQLCNSERSSGEACRSTSPDTLRVVTPFSLDFSICMEAKYLRSRLVESPFEGLILCQWLKSLK